MVYPVLKTLALGGELSPRPECPAFKRERLSAEVAEAEQYKSQYQAAPATGGWGCLFGLSIVQKQSIL
jgi:hypothetical protein